MSVINTNISALAAQSSLRKTGLTQDNAMERLSTGIRINSAKDDAAGLAISTRMTANIRGLSAAIRNANDGISLTQTAEGSLSAIQDNLQRIRELAVQASNTGNNNSDRSALNAESAQLIQEINRVADNTAFNGIKLLDGSFQNQSLQVGAGNELNDRITISIGNAKANALGVGGGSSYLKSVQGVAGNGDAMTSGELVINGFAVGPTTSDGVSKTKGDASGIAIAAAINAITGSTNVTATVDKNTLAGTDPTGGLNAVIQAGDIEINGVKLGAIAATGAADKVTRGAQVAAAVNAVTSQTGVTATFSTTNGAVELAAADGRNITVAYNGNGGTRASDILTGLGASGTKVSTVKISSTGSAGITLAASTTSGAARSGFTTLGYTAAEATAGAGVSTVDLTTVSGAQTALSTLDKAINTVTDSRAAMGAYQNRLTASISNLETTSMNLQASRSRILDTDYAKETTNLAKSQIITQAATAMLAQANQSSQSVLALLK
jgi:flagellin